MIINGTQGADTLNGTADGDVINGLGGADRLNGLGGDDYLYGGEGDDVLVENTGGNDRLFGEDGNDRLTIAFSVALSSATYRLLDGGAGDDIITIGQGADAVTALGGDGADQFYLDARRGQTLTGGSGSDRFTFSLRNGMWTTITDFETGAEGDRFDVASFLASAPGSADPFASGYLALVQRGSGTILMVDFDGGSDSLLPFIYLPGTDALNFTNDNFIGTPSQRIVAASGGSHLLEGAHGTDIFTGGGSDLIDGGAGIDLVNYGGPLSSYRFAEDQGSRYAIGTSGGRSSVDRLEGVEHARFSDVQLHFEAAPVEKSFELADTRFSSLAANPGGGFVIVSTPAADSTAGVFAQFFDETGAPIGDPHHALDGPAGAGDAEFLADGNLVVIAMGFDGNRDGLSGRVLAPDGSPTGETFLVNTTIEGDQRSPRITPLSDGSFVVVWTSEGVALAQHFSPSGSRIGEEFAPTPADRPGSSAALVDAGGGGLLAVWHSGEDVYLRRLALDGSGDGAVVKLNAAPAASSSGTALSALPEGRVLISWSDGYHVFARILEPDGATLGPQIKVNSTLGTFAPTIASFEDGTFVIAWEGHVLKRPALAQRFDAQGNRIGNEFEISSGEFQPAPQIAALGDGSFVAAFETGSFSSYVMKTGVAIYGPPVAQDADTGEAVDVSGLLLDVVAGGEGADVLVASEKSDLVDGRGGDDRLLAALGGKDIVLGGSGSDLLEIDWSASTAPVAPALAFAANPAGGYDGALTHGALERIEFQGIESFILKTGSGADSLTTGAGNDQLDGGAGADSMTGGGGDDLYTVDDANDQVIEAAGEGIDQVRTTLASYTIPDHVDNLAYTGAGNAVLRGNAASNRIEGGAGNDFFHAQHGGDDDIKGGGGNDSVYIGAALTSADKVDGGPGTDTLALQGDYKTAPLTFGAGLTGIELIALMPGNDTRYGAPGNAFYSYDITVVQENAPAGVQVRIDAARLRAGEDFTFDSSAETDGWYRIAGGAGVDDLTTGSRSDSFHFTAATWGAGDRIDAGAGNDQLGLQGNFTIAFGAAQLTGIEILALLSGRDMRENVDYNYAITSADGNVAAGQRLGVDAARLTAGETLLFDGSAEQDGFFRMAGGEGGDTLTGGQGNDVIEGGGGADALRGNGGSDTFLYRDAAHSTVAAADTLLDLTLGDLIGLSGIDADAAAAGDQAFAFIGSAAFGGQAGQLRAEQSGTTGLWTVQGDIDGNGAADFQLLVTVTDAHPLTAADFIL
jgi:Ca2+-binding RTX toxin-like protein